MGKPKRKVLTRAELQAEIEQLSRDRYDAAVRARALREQLHAAHTEIETERRLRRAAEAASAEALRKQRVAEERLLALLDKHLNLEGDRVTHRLSGRDFASDFEADRRG